MSTRRRVIHVLQISLCYLVLPCTTVYDIYHRSAHGRMFWRAGRQYTEHACTLPWCSRHGYLMKNLSTCHGCEVR